MRGTDIEATHLLRHDAVEVNEGRGHPGRKRVILSVETGMTTTDVHVEEPIRKTLCFL